MIINAPTMHASDASRDGVLEAMALASRRLETTGHVLGLGLGLGLGGQILGLGHGLGNHVCTWT